MCAQTTRALSIVVVAKLSTSAVLLRIGATASIRLTRNDVAEPALALQILVTMFVVARPVILVRRQTRILLGGANPALAEFGGTLVVRLAVLAVRTILLTRLLAARVALPCHLATVGVVLTVVVTVAGMVGSP